ncbi:MAG: antibiotic biosynthesis monooxygenase [Desulfovibrio sp.]|nr:MAG: antibiotic biosynthesis monooxygenase [Desulfovibrio sp.]
MNPVYVSAVVEAKPGHGEDLERALAGVVAEVRREQGCIKYDLHRQDERFLFYEIWETQADLDAHGQASHMQALRESIAEIVAGPPLVETWSAVDVA